MWDSKLNCGFALHELFRNLLLWETIGLTGFPVPPCMLNVVEMLFQEWNIVECWLICLHACRGLITSILVGAFVLGAALFNVSKAIFVSLGSTRWGFVIPWRRWSMRLFLANLAATDWDLVPTVLTDCSTSLLIAIGQRPLDLFGLVTC